MMDEIKKIEIKTSSENSFIGCWMIEDTALMDAIVKFFDERNNLHSVGKLVGGRIDRNVKDSLDIAINPKDCLLYTSPSPRDRTRSRMPSSA